MTVGGKVFSASRSDAYLTHSGVWYGSPMDDGDVWMHWAEGDTDMGDMPLSELRHYMRVVKVEPGSDLERELVDKGLIS